MEPFWTPMVMVSIVLLVMPNLYISWNDRWHHIPPGYCEGSESCVMLAPYF